MGTTWANGHVQISACDLWVILWLITFNIPPIEFFSIFSGISEKFPEISTKKNSTLSATATSITSSHSAPLFHFNFIIYFMYFCAKFTKFCARIYMLLLIVTLGHRLIQTSCSRFELNKESIMIDISPVSNEFSFLLSKHYFSTFQYFDFVWKL